MILVLGQEKYKKMEESTAKGHKDPLERILNCQSWNNFSGKVNDYIMIVSDCSPKNEFIVT